MLIEAKNASGELFDPESRLNSEKNITNLITRLATPGVVGKEGSFVISYASDKLLCSIHGYIFEIR